MCPFHPHPLFRGLFPPFVFRETIVPVYLSSFTIWRIRSAVQKHSAPYRPHCFRQPSMLWDLDGPGIPRWFNSLAIFIGEMPDAISSNISLTTFPVSSAEHKPHTNACGYPLLSQNRRDRFHTSVNPNTGAVQYHVII